MITIERQPVLARNNGPIVPVIDVREADPSRPAAILMSKMLTVACMLAVSAAAGAWLGQLR